HGRRAGRVRRPRARRAHRGGREDDGRRAPGRVRGGLRLRARERRRPRAHRPPDGHARPVRPRQLRAQLVDGRRAAHQGGLARGVTAGETERRASMWTYLRKRILQSALPLVAVVLGVFVLARLTGDPSKLYLPLNATEQMRADFAERNGLDRPIWEQMGDYFLGVLRLDFGESLRTGENAASMVLRAFPATLQLAGVTMLLAIVIAVVIGSWAALKPNGIADRIVSFFSIIAAAVPRAAERR